MVSDGSSDGTDEFLRSRAVPAARPRRAPGQRRAGGSAQPRHPAGDGRARRVHRRRRRPGPRPARRPPPPPRGQRQRRHGRHRTDDHAGRRGAVAMGALGAGHALQAVRGDGARRLGGDGAAVLHGQRVDRPPPPRRRRRLRRGVPTGRGRRAGVPARRSRPALHVRQGRHRRSPRRAQLRLVARHRPHVRPQRRHLRPRPRPALAARLDRHRVPRPPPPGAGADPHLRPSTAAAPRGDRHAEGHRPRRERAAPRAAPQSLSALYNLAYYGGMADELGPESAC